MPDVPKYQMRFYRNLRGSGFDLRINHDRSCLIALDGAELDLRYRFSEQNGRRKIWAEPKHESRLVVDSELLRVCGMLMFEDVWRYPWGYRL